MSHPLVSPQKEAILRASSRLNDALLHLDLIDVEKLAGFEFGKRLHLHFGHQVDAGAGSHVSHTGPDGNKPRMIKSRCYRHKGCSLSVAAFHESNA
jgi:hypothetical protein